MLPLGYQLQDLPELHELNSLFRFQRMLFEKGNDSVIQVIQTSHPVRHSLCMIRTNHAAPEKLLECVEQLDVPLMLCNCELREDLESGSHLRVPVDSDEETSFAVNESDHPLRFQFSGMWLNVKSLRVLHEWSLPCGLSPCLSDFDCCLIRQRVLNSCMRSFPHIVQFY